MQPVARVAAPEPAVRGKCPESAKKRGCASFLVGGGGRIIDEGVFRLRLPWKRPRLTLRQDNWRLPVGAQPRFLADSGRERRARVPCAV